jgi:hypothetical protein
MDLLTIFLLLGFSGKGKHSGDAGTFNDPKAETRQQYSHQDLDTHENIMEASKSPA